MAYNYDYRRTRLCLVLRALTKDEGISFEDLCDMVAMSRYYLSRILQKVDSDPIPRWFAGRVVKVLGLTGERRRILLEAIAERKTCKRSSRKQTSLENGELKGWILKTWDRRRR